MNPLNIIPAYRELVRLREAVSTLRTDWYYFKSAFDALQELGDPKSTIEKENARRFTLFVNQHAARIEATLNANPAGPK